MKKLVSILVLGFIVSVGFTQNDERMNQIRAQKSAYITQRLNLTVEESQAFWPVYNEYENKMFALKKNAKSNGIRKHNMDYASMSNEELESLFKQRFEIEEQELAYKKEYHAKFMKLLTPQQVAILYDAEHDFKRELLNRLRGPEERTRR